MGLTDVVLTFPRTLSTQSPQTTWVAWPSFPSHYWAAAVVESAYCCPLIVHSLLLSGTYKLTPRDTKQTLQKRVLNVSVDVKALIPCIEVPWIAILLLPAQIRGYEHKSVSACTTYSFLGIFVELGQWFSCAYIPLSSRILKVFCLISYSTCIGLLKEVSTTA
jgi:hypothetical protein